MIGGCEDSMLSHRDIRLCVVPSLSLDTGNPSSPSSVASLPPSSGCSCPQNGDVSIAPSFSRNDPLGVVQPPLVPELQANGRCKASASSSPKKPFSRFSLGRMHAFYLTQREEIRALSESSIHEAHFRVQLDTRVFRR